MADIPSTGSNRIEVDLRLLQDQNLAVLRDFGDKFESSVDKLIKNFGAYADQIAAAADRIAGATGGATTTSHESRAKPIESDKLSDWEKTLKNVLGYERLSPTTPIAAREAGGGGVGSGGGGSGTTATPAGDDSRAPKWTPREGMIRGAIDRYSFNKPSLTEFEKAQFSLGTVPTDFEGVMRYLSHYAGVLGWNESGENNYLKKGTFASGMRNLSGVLGGAARGATGFKRMYGTFTNVTGSGAADYYAQLGYDRTGKGPFGLLPANPLFSRANAYGMEQNAKAMADAWFGLNPNLSITEAKNINAAVAQAGWSGDQANSYRKMLEGVRADYGISDFNTVMSMSDKSTRFGVQSIGEFRDSMKDVSEAARAAHINLSQFVQSLDSASDSLAQSIGLPYAFAKRDITAFSGATGLDPSRATSILSNQTNTLIAMNRTGLGSYDLTHSAHFASAMTRVSQNWAAGFVGAPLSQWGQIAKTDPTRWKQMRNTLMNMYRFAPQTWQSLIGDTSPDELIRQALQGTTGHMTAFENAETARTRLSQFKQGMRPDGYFMGLNDILHKSGISQHSRNQIMTALQKGHLTQGDIEAGFESKFGTTIGAAQKRKFTNDERSYLSGKEKDRLDRIERFVGNQSRQTEKQKSQYEVTLSPEARRLLRWMDDSKAPTSGRNTKGSFADRAFSWNTGKKILGDTATIAGDIGQGHYLGAAKDLYGDFFG